MKKVKYLIISLVSVFALSNSAYAASASISVSSNNVYVGDTFTVYVNMNGAAAWNLHTIPSGNVSGCVINVADATSDALDINNTFSASCTATGVGVINIGLTGDVTSASDGNPVYVGGSATVNVKEREVVPTPTPDPTPTPEPTPTPAPAPSNNNNNNNSNNNNTNNNNNNNNNKKEETKSDNNKLKEIKVDGQKLVKVDDNNYTLDLFSDIDSINISATLEDDKAKITGDGKHALKDGVNTFELVITSESGKENKVTIKVTKKDGYYIADLEKALETSNPSITLKDDTVISATDLEKIKKSGKTVNFNYLKDKKVLYSFIINGKKIGSNSSIPTSINFSSNNKNEILKLADYNDGLVFGLDKVLNLKDGVKIKVYVGNKFKDGDMVYVYGYKSGDSELGQVASKVKVVDGYITFDGDNASDYFVSLNDINNLMLAKEKKSTPILPIIIGVIALIAIIVIVIIAVKKNKSDKGSKKSNNKSNSTATNNNKKENSGDLDNDFSNLINNNSSNINSMNNNMYEKYTNNVKMNNTNSNNSANTNSNNSTSTGNNNKDLDLDDLMKNF